MKIEAANGKPDALNGRAGYTAPPTFLRPTILERIIRSSAAHVASANPLIRPWGTPFLAATGKERGERLRRMKARRWLGASACRTCIPQNSLSAAIS
jgi:hypothetical protein